MLNHHSSATSVQVKLPTLRVTLRVTLCMKNFLIHFYFASHSANGRNVYSANRSSNRRNFYSTGHSANSYSANRRNFYSTNHEKGKPSTPAGVSRCESKKLTLRVALQIEETKFLRRKTSCSKCCYNFGMTSFTEKLLALKPETPSNLST